MTQDNVPPNDETKGSPAEPAPAKKSRKWLKMLAAAGILLVLLVLFIPTIASMGFVRSIVLGKINQTLDGRLAIDDWSLGWFSGTKLYGVNLLEPSGQKVATIQKITTQMSLLDAIRGNYSLGKTDIDGCEFWIKLDEQGESNFAKVSKKHAKKPQETDQPVSLPEVSGDFTIHAKGQIERAGLPVTHVTSADIHAVLPSIRDELTESAKIETDLAGKITSDGKVPVPALLNILNKRAPEQTGSIDVAWTMPNLEPIATALGTEISLLPNVKITGGEFDQASHVDVRAKDIAITNRLTFSAQGTRDGQPIHLDKVEISKADATFDPTQQSLAGLGNLSVNINSPFITITGGGTSVSNLNVSAQFDLDKLQAQLAQFLDLSTVTLTGTGALQITSSGDQTNLAIQTNNGKANIIDMALSATGVDAASMKIKHFDNKLNIMDLAGAQQQFGSFISLLRDNGIRITAGALYTNVGGSIDGKTRTITIDPGNPFELTTPGLTVQRVDENGKGLDALSDEKITMKMMGVFSAPESGPVSADVRTLSIDTQHNLFSIKKSEGTDLSFKMDDNSISGGGSVVLSADVKAIKDIAQRFGGNLEIKSNSAGQLTSGQLDATLALATAATDTTVKLDGKIANLSVTTSDPKKPIANETVSLALTAGAKNDMSGASASGTISSSFATLNLKDASISLKNKTLEKAQLVAAAPDLAKLDAMAMAFSPPPAPEPAKAKGKKSAPPPVAPEASSPFQVTAGSATLTLNVASDPTAPPGSIASFNGDGLLSIPSVTMSGLEIAKLDIPVTMQKSVFRTVYKDKPEGQNTAPPAQCNGGTLDFSNISLDLSKDVPRLTIPVTGKGRRIIQNVSINSVLGDSLGKFVNPVFANSKQAQGLLDVTVTKCESLALGDKMYGDESGALRIVFSLSDMDIVNPMGSLLVSGVLKQFKMPEMPGGDADVFRGQVRDAVVSVDKGVANTDITLSLVDPSVTPDQSASSSKKKPTTAPAGMPLHFWGDIQLATLKQSLNATLPPQLIAKFVTSIPFVKVKDPSQALIAAFPNGIPVSVKGTTVDPKFDFGDIGKQFVNGFLNNNPDAVKAGADILNQVLGGKKSRDRDNR